MSRFVWYDEKYRGRSDKVFIDARTGDILVRNSLEVVGHVADRERYQIDGHSKETRYAHE